MLLPTFMIPGAELLQEKFILCKNIDIHASLNDHDCLVLIVWIEKQQIKDICRK